MKKLLLLGLLLASQEIAAQCVSISCPTTVTTVADSGSCTAVVNFPSPVATSSCLDSAVFQYTGALETFIVPAGITSITIDAAGAQGGSVNVNCTANGGLGARMRGDFTVIPGDVITILVGQQGLSNGADAGGGGGSFVVAAGNIPLVVAGGGGGATNNIGQCGSNLDGINASIDTSGTASGNGLVAGGTAGNGGGASGGSGGGGGGFYTDGTPGMGLANNNGKSFLNGGIGGTGNNNDFGGYGGGGAGWFTGGNGGGGGGYSGGGTSGSQPFTGGGGGGSFNAGTNQVNTAGFQTGNGRVIIYYSSPAYVTQIQGLPSGSAFPIGTMSQVFVVTDSAGSSDTCSFDVIVEDNQTPVIFCLGNTTTCDSVVTGISATASDSCSGVSSLTYTLTGATTGNGTNDASGTSFNTGITVVTYTATDFAGNTASCSLTVTVLDCSHISETDGFAGLKIFPNPTQGQVNITLDKAYTQVKLSLTQVNGQIIRQVQFPEIQTISMSLEDLPAGIYFLTLQSDNAVKTVKLVKE